MSATGPSPITSAARRRLLRSLDAGVPPPEACRRAGIDFATWEAERSRDPLFAALTDRIETSGLEAALRMLQMTAATEWRAALEYAKLHYSLRGREVVRVNDPDLDEVGAAIAPDDVAAVIRVLRAHELGADVAAHGHTNGHAVDANGAGEVDA